VTFWILHQLKKLFKALNDGQSPKQLALGATLGILIGLAPFNVFYSISLLILLYILNINATMGLLFWLLSGFFAFLLDPMAHALGSYLLIDNMALSGLWTLLYNTPFVPFLRFNNTVMLGSVLLSWLLSPLLYLVFFYLVLGYRNRLRPRLHTLPMVKVLKATRWFR